jgi:hypothetical protein
MTYVTFLTNVFFIILNVIIWGVVFLFLWLEKFLEKLIRIFQFKNIAIILTMNDFDACHFDEVNGIMRSSDAEPTHTKISLSKAQMEEFSLSQTLTLVP